MHACRGRAQLPALLLGLGLALLQALRLAVLHAVAHLALHAPPQALRLAARLCGFARARLRREHQVGVLRTCVAVPSAVSTSGLRRLRRQMCLSSPCPSPATRLHARTAITFCFNTLQEMPV
jgi:hypothetical protein